VISRTRLSCAGAKSAPQLCLASITRNAKKRDTEWRLQYQYIRAGVKLEICYSFSNEADYVRVFKCETR